MFLAELNIVSGREIFNEMKETKDFWSRHSPVVVERNPYLPDSS